MSSSVLNQEPVGGRDWQIMTRVECGEKITQGQTLGFTIIPQK